MVSGSAEKRDLRLDQRQKMRQRRCKLRRFGSADRIAGKKNGIRLFRDHPLDRLIQQILFVLKTPFEVAVAVAQHTLIQSAGKHGFFVAVGKVDDPGHFFRSALMD